MNPFPLLRLRLRLQAPLGTPLTSGTLFGHLCWTILAGDGEARLQAWLAAQEEEPWILSDGLPAGLLPRPLLPPARHPPQQRVQDADAAKKRARLPWVTVEGFLQARDALSSAALARHLKAGPEMSAEDSEKAEELREVRIAHNTIDRRRGTTLDQGGLYFVDEDWSHAVAPLRDVYVRTPAPPGEVERLFRAMGETGYGRDRSWGRGHFALEGPPVPVPELDDHPGPRRLSLSHGVVGPGMARPRYKLFTHYGKVADAMAFTGARVWKRPLLLTRPGMTFEAQGEGPFGALLTGVHQDRPEIVHDARHLAIPCRDAEPAG